MPLWICPARLPGPSPLLVTLLLTTTLLLLPGSLTADDTLPLSNPCQEQGRLLEQQAALGRELRAIKRELAALRAEQSGPGVDDIITGIGFILALFGTAALVRSRRPQAGPERRSGGGA
ncbi:hypothetical protein [Desulfogranum mediterraneum]|uniref:hypothetical protein n=1 Tax=Desulfogranum mediterraneum TaxID=160661 RepID=UPI000425EA2F|nr:hypothetical protein [Desulfogranum mediterraneum]